ncbi:hypothetical protein CIB95_01905 [Lottiidibacillus patelloidae]|uniref:Uncharacterized protein n=1 Tax=Lottiidibacillus patelloidae TaxID=2670334 RepID=A0A263BXN7_9BACI|nr:hypothetical protein [Lottiidibacillus patelloidae]OZM58348.1 hypothetical protein CIB95_01905 [Lottiidibacillus patelloidae]
MKRNLPFILLMLVLSATIGTLWDVWSHVMNKVETFWTPSHAVIYFSVALMGILVLSTVIYESIKMGSFSPRKMENVKGYALTGTGSLIQLISGVLDEIYHSIMGFDVTMWSPPHIGAVFAAVLITLGIFELLGNEKVMWRKWLGSILALAFTVIVMQLSVIEYNVQTSMINQGFAIDHRWGPYSYFLSILLTPLLIYSFILGLKRFNRPVGTLITSIVFLLNITTYLIWNKSPVDLRFPLLLIISGLLFDGLYYLMKNKDKFYIAPTFGAVVGLVIAQEIQNPLAIDGGKLILAFIGSISLAALFHFVAHKKTLDGGYHELTAVSTLLTVAIITIPNYVFAHDEVVGKLAPDLHPIIVLAEFLIIFFGGYVIAKFLANLDFSKK